jgi:hypothetical protein
MLLFTISFVLTISQKGKHKDKNELGTNLKFF